MSSGGRSLPAAPREEPGSVETPQSTRATSYRRIEVIAKGGMGRVELAARQEGRFRRLYAIKRLHDHLLEDGDFESMFLDEARVAGLIDHPNVVGVLDVGRDAEGPYLVMPYVHGIALSRLVGLARKAAVQLPMEVVARIGLDVARGLHAAHEVRDEMGVSLGLVHRDVSPQNILVGFDGVARVTDFGIAKAIGQSTRTSTGVAKGKHAYMSPEQIRLAPLDRRSDLFALGVVLYEALTNERLYSGAGTEGPMRILEEPPPDVGEVRADVPPAMVELLLDLLAKKPAERPVDAGEVALRLERILAELIAGGASHTVEGLLDEIASEDRSKLEERQRRALSAPLTVAPSIASNVAGASSPRPPPRWPLLAAAMMVLAAASGGAWWLWGRPSDVVPPAVAAPTPPPIEPPAAPPIEVAAPEPAVDPAPSPGPAEDEAPGRVSRGRGRARTPRDESTEARPRGTSARVGWEGEEL
jgi:eukaryotic-like serine/threonine-protein kinase